MSFLKKISNLFAPEVQEPSANRFFNADNGDSDSGLVTSNRILEAIFQHFKLTVSRLSTKYNLLYHTSFTIYLKAPNYREISDSLPFIASGAERMLVEEINRHAKNYPGYRPHSELWQFQLVEIPDEAAIDGISAEEMEQSVVIQIQSSLFPPSPQTPEPSTGRIVTTIQGVNSLRAIRNCINPEILGRLHLIERDRIQLNLNLNLNRSDALSSRGFSPMAPPAFPDTAPRNSTGINAAQQHFAVLIAQEGRFLENTGNRPIHTIAMTSNELLIAGRSAMPGHGGVEVVRVDSDRILTPHVRIKRDPSSGQFRISAIGKTTLNQRTMTCDPDCWMTLSKKSIIILDDEIQIRFKAS